LFVLVLSAQGLFISGKQVATIQTPEVFTMATEKKVKIVEDLEETFARTQIGVITDYRGTNTAELSDIRNKLREVQVEYRVVKNSLAQRAAKAAGLEELASLFNGPMAVAFDFSDAPAAARVLSEYLRNNKTNLSIKGGFLKEKPLTPAEVETLSKIPSRQVLISQVMAGLQSPVYGLVNVLAGPMRGFIGVLQARIKQLEGA
jgi:large subunit ribosomal protein L10